MIIKLIKRIIPITLIILLCMIFSQNKNQVFASSETPTENNDTSATESEDKIRFYTIEELIFNKIPALNINVFNTSDVKEDSIIRKIRNSIAVWYVAFRNIATIRSCICNNIYRN